MNASRCNLSPDDQSVPMLAPSLAGTNHVWRWLPCARVIAGRVYVVARGSQTGSIEGKITLMQAGRLQDADPGSYPHCSSRLIRTASAKQLF